MDSPRSEPKPYTMVGTVDRLIGPQGPRAVCRMSPRRDPLRFESPSAPARSDPSVLRNVLWKFGIPLLVAFGAATYLAVPVAERVLTEWFQADVDMRAQLVFNSIEEGLEPL